MVSVWVVPVRTEVPVAITGVAGGVTAMAVAVLLHPELPTPLVAATR